MKAFLLVAGLLVSAAALAQPAAPPAAPSGPATDTYFGVKVEDPYRNLENLTDPAVAAWMKAQSEYARRTLDAIPGRAGLVAKMQEFDKRKAARVATPKIADNDRYFYLKTRPEDQQAKLYCRDGYKGAEVLLFDPETYEAGKVFNINDFLPTYDGSKVAFGISEKGSELGRMLVMDVKAKKLYPEQITPVQGSGWWLPDNASFTYTPFNSADIKAMEARQNMQCLLHRVGTPQSQDRPVFSAQLYPKLGIKPSEVPYAGIDRDARLAYGILGTVDRYLYGYYAPAAALAQPTVNWQPLFRPEQEATNFVSDHQYLYFTTSKNTPRQKIMRMPAARPVVATAELLVPESPDEAINDNELKTTKDGLYFVRTKNGVEAKLYFVARGSQTVQEIKLPAARKGGHPHAGG